mgnify:CR=1 FL=1
MSNLNSILFKKIWPCLFLLLSLLVLVVPAVQSKPAPISAEEKKFLKSLRITPATLWIEAHDFAGEKSDGKKVSLKDFRGSFVFLNFWATWCVPCIKEMPELNKAHASFKENDVEIIAINFAETRSKVDKFVSKHPINFPVLLDKYGNFSQDYRVRNLPVTYFISPDGIIMDTVFGGITQQLIKKKLKQLDQATPTQEQ